MKLQRAIVLAVAVSCSRSGSPAGDQALQYEPTVSQITGTVRLVEKYGPPNFGEDTLTDAKVQVPVLELARAQTVVGDTTSEANRETFRDVREIQLLLPAGSEAMSLAGRAVTATGTLSRAQSGHHYTSVVMMVREIK